VAETDIVQVDRKLRGIQRPVLAQVLAGENHVMPGFQSGHGVVPPIIFGDHGRLVAQLHLLETDSAYRQSLKLPFAQAELVESCPAAFSRGYVQRSTFQFASSLI
jgi:hypothetical protein